MKFIVIGITDNPQPFFPPEVLDIIRKGKVFSGGKRHHELVAPLLPPDALWIDITVPLDAVFKQYISRTSHLTPRISTIIVFASGDPLFFGFANTIRRKMPNAEVVLYPSFNALQMLAHRLIMPYHDMRIVSLTGRPWPDFDRALIERTEKIGILTDREHTPAAIARRMLDYGYSSYMMYVGEHLGNPSLERITTLSLEEAILNELICSSFSSFENGKETTMIPAIIMAIKPTINFFIISLLYLLYIRVCGEEVLMARTMASPTSARSANR